MLLKFLLKWLLGFLKKFRKEQMSHMKYTLALGTNMGDRENNIKQAHNLLEEFGTIIGVSPIIETKAILPAEAPLEWDNTFLNQCLAFRTKLSPLALLNKIKGIEKAMGRPEIYSKWSPRIIDIDILLLENFVFKHKNLQIPHKELNKREFLLDLCETL